MTPVRANDPDDWTALLALIHRAFAGMHGRIEPPSSLHRLTPDAIARQAVAGEVWVIGSPALKRVAFRACRVSLDSDIHAATRGSVCACKRVRVAE